MGYCEDFPCCGHEQGCCPTYSESGEQLDMVCVCGARLPATSRYSLCDGCLHACDEDCPGCPRCEPDEEDGCDCGDCDECDSLGGEDY